MAGSSETGRGLRLLSLDGGGIRGLSELLIIEEIMKRIQSQSNLQHVPRPAEYFDLIGGTSTGGLIAILLGRLGLSAAEAIDVYTRLAEQIFSEKKRKWQDGTFKATILENEIKKVVVERLGSERSDARMLEDDDQGQGCRMFVCATPALNVAFRRRFRNYHVRRHEAYNCTIWEAGRATSAAPTFFKRIKIDGEEFVDAGLGCNNPIKELISEAQLVFGDKRKVDCIVSIGTGKAGVVGFDKPTGFQKVLPLALVNVLRKMATESSNTAEEIEERYADATDLYFRFDVDQGLQDVGLDEWKRLGAVKTHTIAYTMETNVNKKIDRVIATLTERASPRPYDLAQIAGQICSKNKPTSNVPFPRDPDFVDRGDIMAQISDNFSRPDARVALLGFGGIGKSQLAIEYAHRVRDNLPETWVFWVHASNQARMEQGFQQMAETLRIPGRDDPETNIFQILGQWLENTSEKWLLVVDNADDPIMFSRRAREEKAKEESTKGSSRLLTFPPLVTPHLPHNQNGSILITSRNEEASLALVEEDKNVIHVPEMNQEESLDLFFMKLNEKVDRKGALELMNVLEHIPLAITQAAAYLSRQKGRISISQYVKDFNKSDKKTIRLLKPESNNYRRDNEAVGSIIATWQISFDDILQSWPSAADMLSLMSFFNYQAIPEFLLHDHRGSVTSNNTDKNTDEDIDEEFEKRLETLRDYCLVSLSKDKRTFRMHRLVQASTQDWLKSHGKWEKSWRTYLRLMSEAFPSDINSNWETCRQLLPHVESVGCHEPTDEGSTRDWAEILSNVSQYKSMVGEHKEAEQMSRTTLRRCEGVFGEQHRITLAALHNLSSTLLDQGNFEEAKETACRAIEGRKSLLGEGHISTLLSMNVIAGVLQAQGQYEEAEAMLRSVLEGQLPEDHPLTLQSLNNLGAVLERQRKFTEAETIYRKLYEKGEKVFHGSDLRTLRFLHNFASILKHQEKFQEAEGIFRQVIEREGELLGQNALSTIRTRVNLAWVLYDEKNYEEAETISRQALEEQERLLGKGHPDTASGVCILAMALWGEGNFIEAEQMFRRAIQVYEQGFGKDHPDTLGCIRSLEAMLRDKRARNRGKCG